LPTAREGSSFRRHGTEVARPEASSDVPAGDEAVQEGVCSLSWSYGRAVHCTMAFIGDTAEDRASAVCEDLQPNHAPGCWRAFRAGPPVAGSFRTRGAPRVLLARLAVGGVRVVSWEQIAAHVSRGGAPARGGVSARECGVPAHSLVRRRVGRRRAGRIARARPAAPHGEIAAAWDDGFPDADEISTTAECIGGRGKPCRVRATDKPPFVGCD